MLDTPNTQNPLDPAARPGENMVPQSRMNEMAEKNRILTAKLEQIEAEQKAETEKRLLEQKQYQELAEKRGVDLVKAQAEAAKVVNYEKTLAEVLASQVESLPEEKRALVPEELTVAQQLAWLAKHAATLKAPAAFDIGAGKTGGGQGSRFAISPEEHAVAHSFGMTDEEYAKNR